VSEALRGEPRGARLGGPLGVSVLLHGAVIASLIVLHPTASKTLPPMYRVNIVAAPPGPRAPGVIPSTPTPVPPAAEKPPPVPKRAEQIEKAMPALTKAKSPAPRKKTPPATPTPDVTPAKPTTPPPKAGGGPEGGRGTDVATVRTEGVDFPFPGYLENIVRQIALRFHPPGNTSDQAEVLFLIRRDGTVSDFRFLTRSGNFAFDLECQGAVDGAAQVKAFGPLPSGFADDVLPVIFSFDPRVLH
jgi:protein TonB